MKNNKAQYRQGDVFIERIEAIPANAVKQKASRRIILAHGEVTGHHHKVELADPADWWKVGDVSTANEKPNTLVGELFLSLPSGGEVTHDEHGTVTLPPGTYKVVRQREYSPEAIRNVQD